MKPILLLLMFFIVGCNSSDKRIISSGEIIDSTYYSRELDWNIEIPEEYIVDTDEKLEKSTDLRDEIFKTPDGFKNVPTDLNLITFRKGQDNFFSSSVTSMDSTNLTFPVLQDAIVKSIDRTYSSLENTKHTIMDIRNEDRELSF
ncbi:hypothetical protein [Salinimicrobium marinum]|nr:hypothetical protein [Salinimicrobium marinum]